ncbi:MAG TPA: FAD-dependent oxidoreductase, partial [Chloroflexota bacterium]|nr:FAD-dependent oxidoreductase [Chloroflexota bacterium]
MKRSGDHVPALVIGGGVVGCAVLRELARRGIHGVLVDAEPDVGEGTSKANSAIVHTGFDAKPGTAEATLLRRAAELWPTIAEDLGVPFLTVGALMLARSSEEAEKLRHEVAASAERFGVATEWLDRADLRAAAPYVTDAAIAALGIPGESIVDPFWLTRSYAESAVSLGAEIILNHAVTALVVAEDAVRVTLDDGTGLRADQVFNCAGLRGDDIARLAGDDTFTIRPRKGQFLVSEETFGVDRIVLPLPGPLGKGVLVTPIVFGGVLLGPTAEDQQDKSDRSVDRHGREAILAGCRQLVPAVERMVPVRQFAGLRAVSSTGDYILRPATRGDQLFHVAGIRSTGISASPAIAEHAVAWAAARRGWPSAPRHSRAPLPTVSLSEPAGEVLCVCRSISRGEVAAACRTSWSPSTLDALKRRCGVAFGDCQGNLCNVPVARLAAQLRDEPPERTLKHRSGAWVFAPGDPRFLDGGLATASRPRPREGSEEPTLQGIVDLVVIGAG